MRQFLSQEVLKEKVPSIFQTKADAAVSDRYSFVPTNELLSNFEQAGWLPVEAKQVRAYKHDPEFGKHMIRLAPSDRFDLKEFKVGDLEPEIMVLNSHNRSSKLLVELALYRKVCMNGLMVADSAFSKVNVRHMSFNFADILEIISKALSEFNLVYNKIDEYKNIMLTQNERNDFAGSVINMVWDGRKFTPSQILNPRREEDRNEDLFSTFNIIQENVMRGGMVFKTKKGQKKSRSIRSINGEVTINKNLWLMMEAFRTTKTFAMS